MELHSIKESGTTQPGTPNSPGSPLVTPPPVCRMQSACDFATTIEALTHIDNSLPPTAQRHLALGYIHRLLASQHSAIRLVAQIIIPWLAHHNYRDLVLEILPRGNPDSLIAREIRLFNLRGAIGPEMRRFISVTDQLNFEALLQSAHAHGVRIHAGGASYRTAQWIFSRPGLPIPPVIMARARREIAANSERAIREIQARGANSVSLNGIIHNDINPPSDHSPADSFGHTLVTTPPRTLGRRPFAYAEVELVMPELAGFGHHYTDLPLPPDCAWEQFIPLSGVRLLSASIISSPRFQYRTFLIYYPNSHPASSP